MEHGLCRALMRVGSGSSSGPSFLQGNRPLLFRCLNFLFYLVYSLNLDSNLVSIPTNLCNQVEYFCNIVMINFMIRLCQSVILHLNYSIFLQCYDIIHYLANFEILIE
jgi:hypothetical protein